MLRTATTETVPRKTDKKIILCGACESELEPDHGGIQCVQGHHYCMDCSVHIVNLFFSDPQRYTPARCVLCHIELNSGVFERQLKPEQIDFYHQHMLFLVLAKDLLEQGERLDHCPFCCFAVIRSQYDTNILYCAHPDCGKTSCLICRKECPKFEHNYSFNAEEYEKVAEMEKHFICAALADDKRIFDDALEQGQKVACPKCGLAGMKDDACTHMTCPTCSQLWCYFCGKKVEECDKTEGSDEKNIYEHNNEWERNTKRCPMYLTQISDCDTRWPEDEEQCLIMFHRNRSIRLLRAAIERLGDQRVEELNRHFHSLDSCGFSLEEIKNEDLTLIVLGSGSRSPSSGSGNETE